MGMFMHKPENPTEWAGLPSEPLEPRSAAEQLEADLAAESAALGLASGGVTSISIPIALPPRDSEPGTGA